MGKKITLDLEIKTGETLLDESAVSTLTNAMNNYEREALERHNYTMRSTGSQNAQALDLKRMLKWITAHRSLLGSGKESEVPSVNLNHIDLNQLKPYFNIDRLKRMMGQRDEEEPVASMNNSRTPTQSGCLKRTRMERRTETTTPEDLRKYKQTEKDEPRYGDATKALFNTPVGELEMRKRLRFEIETQQKNSDWQRKRQ
jgi:hypothetical protein